MTRALIYRLTVTMGFRDLQEDHVKGQACLGCKRNVLGKKPQDRALGEKSPGISAGALWCWDRPQDRLPHG
jgi:hypothetical protein